MGEPKKRPKRRSKPTATDRAEADAIVTRLLVESRKRLGPGRPSRTELVRWARIHWLVAIGLEAKAASAPVHVVVPTSPIITEAAKSVPPATKPKKHLPRNNAPIVGARVARTATPKPSAGQVAPSKRPMPTAEEVLARPLVVIPRATLGMS